MVSGTGKIHISIIPLDHIASGDHPIGTRSLYPEIKWKRREADHSLPSSGEIKAAYSSTSTSSPHCVTLN